MRTPVLSVLLTLALVLASGAARAHEGHDHDAGSAPAMPVAAAGPRFAASSDAFELVGQLQGRELRLWLDRAATNTPVASGSLVLELGERTLEATRDGDTWRVTLPAPLPPGSVPVTATVMVGNDTDLLAGTLEVPPAEAAAAGPAPVLPPPRLVLPAAAGLAALFILVLVWRRNRRTAAQ